MLRRIIRRAVLHGKKLGVNDIFLYKLVTPVIDSMHYAIDFFHKKKNSIEKILFYEENLFAVTLFKGVGLLEKQLLCLSSGAVFSGEIVFDLYNTYGLPLELTKSICLKRNIQIDQIGFDAAMLNQKKESKKSSQFYLPYNRIISHDCMESVFVGYQQLQHRSKILQLFRDDQSVSIILSKENGVIILQETPFYGESGGQIGDIGELKTEFGCFRVVCTKKYGKFIEHIGVMSYGTFRIGDVVIAVVDQYHRTRVCLNHSAHHLLRIALFEILGEHVIQKGSCINDQQLRFDFSHYEALTTDQVEAVENFVNKNIWNNLIVKTDIMSISKAKTNGVIMLPNKTYDDQSMLRVVNMGDGVSVELCGGTHVNNTGVIGLFIIIKESSVASGIRRIEGITGENALRFVHQQKKLIRNISQLMHHNSTDQSVLDRICKFKFDYCKLEKEIGYLKKVQVIQQSVFLMEEFFLIKDIRVLMKKFVNMDAKTLFSIIDYLKCRINSGLIIFFNYNNKINKIHLIVSTTKDLIENNRINSVNIMRYIIDMFGGKGGGRSDFAQASIHEIKEISTFVTAIDSLLRNML